VSVVSEFFIPFGSIINSFRSKANSFYNYGYNVLNGVTSFNQYGRDQEKLTMVLSNPAVLKVFCLQCDLFSMGKVSVQKNEKDIEDDPFLALVENPNPFTKTQSQFLWDFMFWNMLGTSYSLVDSAIVDRESNRMYFLNPAQIEWPVEMERMKDKMIFGDDGLSKIKDMTITYRYQDGTTLQFPFEKLVITYDLTNSTGNFFRGPSRLDALYKVITNSEYTLDAENINIRYSGKFLVGSDKAVGPSIKVGMSTEEKDDITAKIDTSEKSVWPLQSMVKIQRFVSDMAALELKEQYLHQYFIIGSMYGIPRDVLEAYNSSTYENQEKARAAHVNYCLEPKGEQFMDGYENHFGYPTQKKNITISWDHLPFMQVFAKEKSENQKLTIENLNSLLTLGVSIEQANEYLGTQFEIEEPEEEPQNGEGQAEGGQDQIGQTDSGEAEGDAEQPTDKKVNGFRLQVSNH